MNQDSSFCSVSGSPQKPSKARRYWPWVFVFLFFIGAGWFYLTFFYSWGLLATLTGHTDCITCIAYSPDGKTIATTSRDGTIRLWDLESTQEIRILGSNLGEVWSVIFSEDGKLVVAASEDGTARVWETATLGEVFKGVSEPFFPYFTVGLSPDGQIMAAGGGKIFSGGVIRIWNLSTKEHMKILDEYPVISLVFTNNQLLISRNSHGSIKVWDLTKRKVVKQYQYPGRTGPNYLAISITRKYLAANNIGDKETGVVIWDVSANQEKELMTLKRDCKWGIGSIAFSPDDKLLAGTHILGPKVTFWNTKNGALLSYARLLHVNRIAFSPDGTTLATGDSSGNLKLFDIQILLHRQKGVRGVFNFPF